MLLIGSQEKYLLSFKNVFENVSIKKKISREINDLLVGGDGLTTAILHVYKLCFCLNIVAFVSIGKS